MQPIKTQDCYIPVDIKDNTTYLKSYKISPVSDVKPFLIYAEKRSGVIVLDVEEFKKLIGDAFDAGRERPYTEKAKAEYVNQLITP